MSDKEQPNTLYHYTSNNAFISIIEMKKIWLSDLRLSNDTSEGKYAFNLVKEILEEYNVLMNPRLINIMGRASTAFGFCFTGNGDILSQWRAYSLDARGICIGFRREFFVDLLNKEDLSRCPLELKKSGL